MAIINKTTIYLLIYYINIKLLKKVLNNMDTDYSYTRLI